MSRTLSIWIFYYDSATNCNWIPHHYTVLPVNYNNTWDDPVCWLWCFIARVPCGRPHGSISYVSPASARKNPIPLYLYIASTCGYAEVVATYLGKYGRKLPAIPTLKNTRTPWGLVYFKTEYYQPDSQFWGECEKLETEQQQTLYYQLQFRLTSKINNNTIGYYSDIIQRSLILLGVFPASKR